MTDFTQVVQTNTDMNLSRTIPFKEISQAATTYLHEKLKNVLYGDKKYGEMGSWIIEATHQYGELEVALWRGQHTGPPHVVAVFRKSFPSIHINVSYKELGEHTASWKEFREADSVVCCLALAWLVLEGDE